MEYKNLEVKTSSGIIILTINREKALNALNRQTMEELEDFFTKVAPRRKKAKGIIITGAGEKSFVAGADIKEFLALGEADAMRLSKKGQDIFFLIERFPKPVIAAVNGFALGGGCELAMACHIKAIELMMTGDMIGAEEAKSLGLVNHVVPHGEEVNKAKEILKKIGTKAPVAISKVITCANAYYDGVQDGYAIEVEEFGASANTEDFKEGATAFIERRPAKFSGK